MTIQNGLREIDRQALDFIHERWNETGFTPSSGEVAEHFNIGRGGSTNKIFTALESHGFIVFCEGRNRYILKDWRDYVETEFAKGLGYKSAYDIPEASEWEKRKQSDSSDMERVRELQRKRAKQWRDRQKKKRERRNE